MFRKKPLMDELKEYIRKNLKKGYTRESLRWALVNQGYSRMEVEKALKRVDMEMADRAPVLKTKPEIKYRLVEPEPAKENKKSFWKKWF